jgi:hypothetical protein
MGLVVAAVVFICVGLAMIFDPVPYYSPGGVGAYASTAVTSVFSANDTAFIGYILMFCGGLVLVFAYKIKNS